MAAARMPGPGDAVSLARHVDVCHHRLEPVQAVDQRSGLVAGAGLDDMEALVIEDLRQDHADQILILDYENAIASHMPILLNMPLVLGVSVIPAYSRRLELDRFVPRAPILFAFCLPLYIRRNV